MVGRGSDAVHRLASSGLSWGRVSDAVSFSRGAMEDANWMLPRLRTIPYFSDQGKKAEINSRFCLRGARSPLHRASDDGRGEHALQQN